jgi:hypothetical protein
MAGHEAAAHAGVRVLALVVLSGHGEWVPALLLLFLGDYLLQGRYFTLPLKLALLAGPICFVAAGVLYGSKDGLWRGRRAERRG